VLGRTRALVADTESKAPNRVYMYRIN
jgi:hypothetical protein